MKKIVSYTIVGIAGYLVGFYEMKYKVINAIVKTMVEEKLKNDKEES